MTGLVGMKMPALASNFTPYAQDAFEKAQQSGKPILVEVWASWCPTCTSQEPIINSLRTKEGFENFAIFRVDFDAQRDVVRSFGAQMQSTLIVFKGSEEVGRSVGVTDAGEIESLMKKAL
jgi:thioredoxin-like negative regulator of GroEL